MHADLTNLIRLQELDNKVDAARRTIGDAPTKIVAIEAGIAAKLAALDAARQQLADNKTMRGGVEKELSVVQGRLSRYKDQLMAVKTNKEYQAMQHEIATAESEVRRFEDQLLELMLQADELTAAVKEAERTLASENAAAENDRRELELTRTTLEQELQRLAAARAELVAQTGAQAIALFDHVAKSRGPLVVAEARDGLCTVCHVRLRPQVFNDVRRNDSLIQCESCHRILYFVPAAARV
jgi:predicted  nucleic acid-binding Zn-ribbon protein